MHQERLRTTAIFKHVSRFIFMMIHKMHFRYNTCERVYFEKVNKELINIDSKDGFNIFYDKFCKENGAVSDKKIENCFTPK